MITLLTLLQVHSGWHSSFDWYVIIIGLAVLIGIAIVLVVPFLVAEIAEKQGRSRTGWFFLSLLISPPFAVLVLIALGDTDDKRKERIKEDERIRKEMRWE